MNDVVDRFRDLLGSGCMTDPELIASYLSDWRGLLRGRAACVLRPRSVELLSACIRVCHEAGVSVVPQGGNTGLVGAATLDESGMQVVVSTGAMKKIRSVDPIDMSMIAEAGATIAELQAMAVEAGVLFPLSYASEGTATLGGALATNAGGVSAVRYGSARDLLLGMEVVLPDGQIWNGLRTLRKDNTGYALKHLFAGSEGTLDSAPLRPKTRCSTFGSNCVRSPMGMYGPSSILLVPVSIWRNMRDFARPSRERTIMF